MGWGAEGKNTRQAGQPALTTHPPRLCFVHTLGADAVEPTPPNRRHHHHHDLLTRPRWAGAQRERTRGKPGSPLLLPTLPGSALFTPWVLMPWNPPHPTDATITITTYSPGLDGLGRRGKEDEASRAARSYYPPSPALLCSHLGC